MQLMAGGDAGVIRGHDRLRLILVRRYFKKIPAEVSKKLDFGHLIVWGENDDDDPRAEKIPGGGVICLDFPIEGRGVSG
ncbi:MAG: hypothetical protein IJ189_07550 [Clostridia bacterium]|nr:hypothetical protein [Clostridia bacterium]